MRAEAFGGFFDPRVPPHVYYAQSTQEDSPLREHMCTWKNHDVQVGSRDWPELWGTGREFFISVPQAGKIIIIMC